MNSRREDLLKAKYENETKEEITARLNKNNVMCQNHFEDNQFTNVNTKRRLVRTAVPTLFDIPNPPPRITCKRPPPKQRKAIQPPTKKRKTVQKRTGKILFSINVMINVIF